MGNTQQPSFPCPDQSYGLPIDYDQVQEIPAFVQNHIAVSYPYDNENKITPLALPP